MVVLLHDLPSLSVLIQLAGRGLNEDIPTIQLGSNCFRRRVKMLLLLTDDSHAFNPEALVPTTVYDDPLAGSCSHFQWFLALLEGTLYVLLMRVVH